MNDVDKTKEQLVQELAEMRQRVAGLEAREAERKRTEAALSESRAQWRSLTETSPDLILTLDADLIIRFANRASPGLAVDELIGKPLYYYVKEAQQPEIKAILKRVLQTGEPARYETQYDAPDGETIYYESRVMPRRPSGEVIGLILSARDITVRKRAEAALRKSEEHYRLLFEHLPIPVFTKNREGEYTSCNVENRRYWAVNPVGRTDAELLDHETVAALREADLRVMETGDTLTVEELLANTPLGDRRVLTRKVPLRDDNGNIVGILGASIDITESKRTESALRESEERYRRLVESSDDMIFSIDRAGVYKTAGGMRLREYGLKPEDVVGHSLEELFGDEAAQYHERNWKVFESGQAITYEHTFEFAGLTRTDLTTIYPIRDEHGEVELVGIICRDITERKQAEEALRESAETKTSLLREVNHRVKNNLTAIIGLLDATRSRVEDISPADYPTAIDDLINRVQGLATVHSLLSAAEWSPLQLSELASQVIRATWQTLPLDKRVALEVASSPVHVSPDQAHHLALVINELATNVTKHAWGGRDTLQITIRIDAEDDTVYFEFCDDGPGYPEDVLKLERQNAGLNLVQIVVSKNLGGELSLRNDHGAVTAIRFRLGA